MRKQFFSLFLAASRILVVIPVAQAFASEEGVMLGSVPLYADKGGATEVCPRFSGQRQVQLIDAIEQALCSSPKTRGAWANVKAAVENVRLDRAAFLPDLSVSAQATLEHMSTQVRDSPLLNSSYGNKTYDGQLSLEWLLFDFGGRSAELANTRRLVEAARAAQTETLEEVVAEVVKAYLAAQYAREMRLSTQRVEEVASLTLRAATARVNGGVAAVTDQLQSNSAYLEAHYQRVKAENDYRLAIGILAIKMDQPPDAIIGLDVDTLSDEGLALQDSSLTDLVNTAVISHPNVMEAEAQWKAAQAKVAEARAAGLPSISMLGQINFSTQPVSASLGQEEQPAITRDRYIGLKISVPLTDAAIRTSKIREAEYESDAREQNLRDIRRQVSSSIWTSYQKVRSNVANLRNSVDLLGGVREAVTAVQERYQRGVGGILEVLSSQGALNLAEQQHVQALFDERNSCVDLALSIGQIDSLIIHRRY